MVKTCRWIPILVACFALSAMAEELNKLQKLVLTPLGLYPKETRVAILDISGHPELLDALIADPEKATTPEALAKYDPAVRAAAQELADYPSVSEVLKEFPRYTKIIASVYARRPAAVKEFVLSLDEKGAAPGSSDGAQEPSAPEEPAASEEPTANQEPAATEEPASSSGSEEKPTSSQEAFYEIYPYAAEEVAQAIAASGHAWGTYALYDYILQNHAQYQEAALALLECAEQSLIPAVEDWVTAMEQAVGTIYECGQAKEFLELCDFSKLVNEKIGRDWLNQQDRVRQVLGNVEKFPHMAAKALDHHKGKNNAAVEEFLNKAKTEWKVPFDPKDGKLFTEAAGLLKSSPALRSDPANGLASALRKANSNPALSSHLLKNGTGPEVDKFRQLNPKSAQHLAGRSNPGTRQLSSKGLSNASRRTPDRATKSRSINQSAAKHRSIWGGGRSGGAGGRPGGGGGRR